MVRMMVMKIEMMKMERMMVMEMLAEMLKMERMGKAIHLIPIEEK